MPNILRTNEFIRASLDESLSSPSGNYWLGFQSGGLCLREGAKGPILWQTPERERFSSGLAYAIMQSDGNFCVYDGIQPDYPPKRHTCVWHLGEAHAGEAFAAILGDDGSFTVNEVKNGQNIPYWRSSSGWLRKLRLLTYNLHLMADSNLDFAASQTHKQPVVFQDVMRRGHIIDRIIKSGADIVALQEVWAVEWLKYFYGHTELRKHYAYAVYGNKGSDFGGSAGIMLLSKHPLSQYGSKEFEGASDFQEKVGAKGAMSATVLLPGGGEARVGCTHCWTDAGGDGLNNINDLIYITMNDPEIGKRYDNAAILMGDFNIHRFGTDGKFKKLTDMMNGAKAVDTWEVLNPGKREASYTDDAARNTLAAFFSPMRNTAEGDCIDYIYLGNGPGVDFRPVRAEVLRDWTYDSTPVSPAWYWVHLGHAGGLPSVTTMGDQLCVATRNLGLGEQSPGTLQIAVFDPNTRRWTHHRNLDDGKELKCDGAPGIVGVPGTMAMFLFYKLNRKVYMAETNGARIGRKIELSPKIRTSGGLCPILHKGVLYLFVRQDDGKDVFVHKCSNFRVPDTDGWDGGKRLSISTNSDMSAASLGDTLCLVTKDNQVRGTTSGVMRATMGGDGNWSQGYQIGDGIVTSGPPGVCAANGRFELYFRAGEGNNIVHYSSSNGVAWQKEGDTPHSSRHGVAPIFYEGKKMLFYAWVGNSTMMYPDYALTHGFDPPGIQLDLSDHYPYMVDVIY